MAKAQFHKGQRVYVDPVGTWALIEHIVPHWVKGMSEPLKVNYDVGMGREFAADELRSEEIASTSDLLEDGNQWRLVRGVNKWKTAEECAHHPYPGTHPVVVTSDSEWGGWRVPGSEYDLDPGRVEMQARIITQSLHCVTLLRKMSQYADEQPENFSNQLLDLVHEARRILANIQNETVEESANIPVAEDGESAVAAPAPPPQTQMAG